MKKKKCRHIDQALHFERNTYPYGANIEWYECMKCGEKFDIKIL